ncbi:MAG: zf-HC2 domain-containing protein [Firmicutes bacterium]|nr:zf-HC2 domain-containing protein [Bacillota bacterium]
MNGEINCEVVCDLLPPYAYGLANPSTRALVEGHLENCARCNKALEQLRIEEKEAPLPPDRALSRVKKKIRRKRLRIALLSAAAAIAVLCAGFYFLVLRDYPVPYREGDLRVDRRDEETFALDENGQLMLSYFRDDYLSSYGPIQHFCADGSIQVTHFVHLMQYPELKNKINGEKHDKPDGEWRGSMYLNWSPDDGDYYTLKVKPTKVTCRVYYLEDFGKLKPKGNGIFQEVNNMSTDDPNYRPSEEELLPYELTEEVLSRCTLIWEGDITPTE